MYVRDVRFNSRDFTKIGNQHYYVSWRIIYIFHADIKPNRSMYESFTERVKRKGMFYIAQCPVHWTAQSALHILPSLQTCSFQHQLGFSGKHSRHAAITLEDYSLTFPPLYIARYPFIQPGELGRHGENANAQASKRIRTVSIG